MILDKKIIYFILVVEKGSFSGAARELYLSQAAISQQIVLLEEELGILLFDRSGYKPSLTKEGEDFYKGCVSIKNQCMELLQRTKEKQKQCLRIGFPGLFESKEILHVIKKYQMKHPDVEFSFLNNSFSGCLKDLIEKKTDLSFGLSCEFKECKEIVYERLFQYELYVICSKKHPLAQTKEITPRELNLQDLIILSAKYGKGYYKAFMHAMHKDRMKPKSIKEADTFDELLFDVSLGNGIAIASSNVISDENITLIKLKESHHKSEAAIAYKQDKASPLLLDFIKECRLEFESL